MNEFELKRLTEGSINIMATEISREIEQRHSDAALIERMDRLMRILTQQQLIIEEEPS